jgi:hypothetical protein
LKTIAVNLRPEPDFDGCVRTGLQLSPDLLEWAEQYSAGLSLYVSDLVRDLLEQEKHREARPFVSHAVGPWFIVKDGKNIPLHPAPDFLALLEPPQA